MKKLLTLRISIGIFPLAFLISACYPDENLTIEDLDIVGTFYEENTNYNIYSTFLMPDTIIQIGDPESAGYIELELENQDEILDQVRSNFIALGYVEETDPDVEPDLVILVEVIANDNYVLFTYPGGGWWNWWGWYPWYPGWGWGGGWGPGYPYYPPTGVYTYPTGTLIVDMLDAGAPAPTLGDDIIPALWTGVLNGLLIETNNPNRVFDGIDQMFNQSQYLKIN